MNSYHHVAVTLLLASLAPAALADTGMTREQVKAELARAIRDGDVASGYNSLTLREQYPGRYPARPAPAGKTRDQVRAELAEAVRTGDIETGESSLKLYERFPAVYANARRSAGKAQAAGTP